MTDIETIKKTIIETFEKNLFSMPPKYQYHWCTRIWRISPKDKYLNPILVDFQLRTLTSIPKIANLSFLKNAKRIGQEMLENYSVSTPKKKARYDYYVTKPETLFFLNLAHYLFLMKSYNFHNLGQLKDYFQKGKAILKKANLESIFLNEDYILVNPSGVANTIYYLKFLKVTDLEAKLIETYRNLWLSYEPTDEIGWQNKVYGLTHLVIAASYFYQRKVDKEKFDWLLKYFDENIEKVMEKTNTDIIAEVGLCFKLCGVKKHAVIEKVLNHLATKFSSREGIILREGQRGKLEKAEHRNIVAALLMSDYPKLHKGPNLLDYISRTGRGIFISKKISFVGKDESIED